LRREIEFANEPVLERHPLAKPEYKFRAPGQSGDCAPPAHFVCNKPEDKRHNNPGRPRGSHNISAI
jgi:hypothetical protein